MPKIFRFYILHCVIGFAAAAVFISALLWFNVANLSKFLAGGRLGLHQDDEPQHASPLVMSISIGSSAIFRAGSLKLTINEGDIILFDRLTQHSVSDIEGERYNITFRSWNDVPYYNLQDHLYKPHLESQEEKKE